MVIKGKGTFCMKNKESFLFDIQSRISRGDQMSVGKDVLDAIILILEDSKVVFNKSVKRLYKCHGYSKKDELPSSRAKHAAKFRCECAKFLQDYVDCQVDIFGGSVSGLQEFYNSIRDEIHNIFSDGFMNTEIKRRLNDDSILISPPEEFVDILADLLGDIIFFPVPVCAGIIWLYYLFQDREYVGYLRRYQSKRMAKNLSIRLYARKDAVDVIDRAINYFRRYYDKSQLKIDNTGLLQRSRSVIDME